MRIAYLVNRYPAASHSFIRREIAAIEAEGGEVHRFTIRGATAAELPDPRDRSEVERTTVLLGAGLWRLAVALVAALIASPRKGWAAAGVAFKGADANPSRLVRRIAYLVEGALLARKMRSARIDHLHAHFGTNPAMVARIASRLSGIPYSFTVHGPDEFDAPAALDLGGKIGDCAFCVAISSYGRSQLMRWSRVSDWPKIEVVRCGVDESFLERESIPPPREARLCAVARLSGQKGIPLLIEAAARLRKKGVDFRLDIIGDGELRPIIAAMIARHDLAETVNLVGWASSERVIELLEQVRAMVLPSFAEGLPVVIMESLALGRPVVVTAIAGTPELVDDRCGWIIPAGSVDALADAMTAAIEASPDQIARLGAEGRQRVRARHDARANGRQLYEIITGYADDAR